MPKPRRPRNIDSLKKQILTGLVAQKMMKRKSMRRNQLLAAAINAMRKRIK